MSTRTLGKSAGGGGRFKTGTYTGTGATTAVTGVGFSPIAVFIYPQVDSVNGDGTRTTADPANTMNYGTVPNQYLYNAPHIDSLDADGFTVSGASFDVADRVYVYYCFG